MIDIYDEAERQAAVLAQIDWEAIAITDDERLVMPFTCAYAPCPCHERETQHQQRNPGWECFHPHHIQLVVWESNNFPDPDEFLACGKNNWMWAETFDVYHDSDEDPDGKAIYWFVCSYHSRPYGHDGEFTYEILQLTVKRLGPAQYETQALIRWSVS